MSATLNNRTIAFLGGSGGCGLSTLKLAVAAGHTCIALARTPAKFEALFPNKPANLHIRQGNAHDADSVAACLTHPSDPARLVDSVSFTIGGLFDPWKFTIDDPDVCKKGIATLLTALNNLRSAGAVGSPLLAVISTTGISKHGRDVPLAFFPFYHYGLAVPHADKQVMEERLLASPERWVAVRPSFLVDGGKPERKIRVGVEDLTSGIEKKEVGYTISREDVGRWMYENLLVAENPQYQGKAVSITW
ncbi:hypothetical protein EDB81DRAFT_798965 [Dactylonectria macrodidyma]|uniref:NAD(P)-binding domain-containing protein n=1 Tax=Dactylonectria macrodidyma TaxID=307937 RepID=A0A9P9J2G7_9HYPO|nr:hypothetical protein EDB81DRAFT_798965 [Dactylonectria macrodidyma]